MQGQTMHVDVEESERTGTPYIAPATELGSLVVGSGTGHKMSGTGIRCHILLAFWLDDEQ